MMSEISKKSMPPRKNGTISRMKKQNSQTFIKWIPSLNHEGQILIQGILESKKCARSQPIKRRLNSVHLLSIDGTLYHLIGTIDKVFGKLPEYVQSKFLYGFPSDWNHVREIWYSYTLLGCKPSFRWPKELTDTDCDARTDFDESIIPRPRGLEDTLLSSPNIDDAKENVPMYESRKSLAARKLIAKRSRIRSEIREKKESETNNLNNKVPLRTSNVNPANLAERKDMLAYHTLDSDSSDTEDIISKKSIEMVLNYLQTIECPASFIRKVMDSIDCMNDVAAVAGNGYQTDRNDLETFRKNETYQRVDYFQLPYAMYVPDHSTIHSDTLDDLATSGSQSYKHVAACYGKSSEGFSFSKRPTVRKGHCSKKGAKNPEQLDGDDPETLAKNETSRRTDFPKPPYAINISDHLICANSRDELSKADSRSSKYKIASHRKSIEDSESSVLQTVDIRHNLKKNRRNSAQLARDELETIPRSMMPRRVHFFKPPYEIDIPDHTTIHFDDKDELVKTGLVINQRDTAFRRKSIRSLASSNLPNLHVVQNDKTSRNERSHLTKMIPTRHTYAICDSDTATSSSLDANSDSETGALLDDGLIVNDESVSSKCRRSAKSAHIHRSMRNTIKFNTSHQRHQWFSEPNDLQETMLSPPTVNIPQRQSLMHPLGLRTKPENRSRGSKHQVNHELPDSPDSPIDRHVTNARNKRFFEAKKTRSSRSARKIAFFD